MHHTNRNAEASQKKSISFVFHSFYILQHHDYDNFIQFGEKVISSSLAFVLFSFSPLMRISRK